MTWTVEHDEAITGIINVNDELVRNDYYGLMPRLEEFLSVFFAALLDGPEPFRVAIVTNLSGQVAGPVEYVDQSFSVDDAVTAAEEMLDGGQLKGDNDQGLETCLNAIARNEEWLLDDKGPWADSNLNLVVINYDMEQSPYDATYYVDRYLLEKSSWDLAVHGIAGDVPGGCQLASGGKGVGAAPAVNLHDATVATGGAYLSICEPSWVGWAETLALRFAARYVLEGSPSLESLEVFVDGTPMSSGWSYDETTHELTFDDPSAPDEGAELRVDYARCD
jgi:hypothetical protein